MERPERVTENDWKLLKVKYIITQYLLNLQGYAHKVFANSSHVIIMAET